MPTSIIKSPSTPSKRRVSFNKHVQAVHIRHHRDYSKKEIKSCWYSCRDYEAIKEEVNHTIDHFNRPQSDMLSAESSSSSQDVDQSNFCLRGLEHRTNHSKNGLKAHLRRAAWTAVLDEQDDQYDLGMSNNSAMLREVYSIYSLPASRIAQHRGWKDAIEAGYTVEPDAMAVIAKTSERASRLPASAIQRMSTQKNSIVSKAA